MSESEQASGIFRGGHMDGITLTPEDGMMPTTFKDPASGLLVRYTQNGEVDSQGRHVFVVAAAPTEEAP